MITKDCNGFLAMRHAGVTRAMLRECRDRSARLLMWLLVTAAVEFDKQDL